VAGVPPVRREALRVQVGFLSFSRADVKTPEFRGSFSFIRTKFSRISIAPPLEEQVGKSREDTKVHFSELM
jgi:hypothetical protein